MRKLRLQVVRTADDDGSNVGAITANGVVSLVSTANQIFADADVEFVYDPATDFTHINSTLLNRDFTPLSDLTKATDKDKEPAVTQVPHRRAKRQIAELFNDSITVFFSRRSRLAFSTSKGHWEELSGNKHSSSGLGGWVNMLGSASGSILAHEIGHFLQNRHPFGKRPATVAEAAETIKKYVEDGHDKADGIAVFDGDVRWVTDTPPDPGPALFEAVHGSACATDEKVDVEVTFADGTKKTYGLGPDRTNVMSYFRCNNLGMPVSLTAQQAWRVRDTLDTGLRHRLIATSAAQLAGHLTRKGSAVADVAALSRLRTLAIGNGRVVTVARGADDKLNLTAWDVSDDGATITKRGSAQAGVVKEVAACYAGLGLVVTAVKTSSDVLKMIVWKVSESGAITRKGDATDEAMGAALSTCRIGMEYLATGTTTSAGTVRIAIWRVRADGTIARTSTASAGAASQIALAESWNTDITTDGSDVVDYAQLTSAVRDSGGDLKLIHWAIADDGKSIRRLADASAGAVDDIALCSLPPRSLISAMRDSGDNLRLISWMLDEGGLAVNRWDSAVAGKIKDLDTCIAGRDLVATAVRTEGNNLKVIVWRPIANGAEIVRIADNEAGGAALITVCQSSPGVLVTGIKDKSGDLKLIAWKLS